MKAKVIIMLILIGIFISFVVQNTEVVDLHFMFFSFSISLVLLLFIFFAVGIIVGMMLPGILTSKKKTTGVNNK
ncbi:MAG: lipopolysaccharide assembly protein LapA domain-containing protein [Ignavibacterium sp.]|uniref:lipopolysaccharide assembly protein LapA domain-containing protein n=1 Tax=Ignavibacterium sp. TaxID=2651167 RepID=UPI00404B4CA9